jgi:hypothetical protein
MRGNGNKSLSFLNSVHARWYFCIWTWKIKEKFNCIIIFSFLATPANFQTRGKKKKINNLSLPSPLLPCSGMGMEILWDGGIRHGYGKMVLTLVKFAIYTPICWRNSQLDLLVKWARNKLVPGYYHWYN